MKKESEQSIQRGILQYAAYKKIFCYKQNTTGIYRKSTDSYIPSPSRGAPDLVCIVGGKYIGVECKTKRGAQSPVQLEFQRKIEKAGGKYLIARSVEDAYEIENNE